MLESVYVIRYSGGQEFCFMLFLEFLFFILSRTVLFNVFKNFIIFFKSKTSSFGQMKSDIKIPTYKTSEEWL